MGKRRLRKQLFTLALGIAIVAATYSQIKPAEPARSQPMPGSYQVVEVADGDTISVNMQGRREKVRLLGVDTPETHDPRKAVQCFGHQAADFTKHLIGNQTVKLAADPESQNRDRYNRLLRYAYLPDGRLVNREIIVQGYGFAYLNFPFSKQQDFRQAQTSAQAAKRGLWRACTPQPNQYGGYTSNPQ